MGSRAVVGLFVIVLSVCVVTEGCRDMPERAAAPVEGSDREPACSADGSATDGEPTGDGTSSAQDSSGAPSDLAQPQVGSDGALPRQKKMRQCPSDMVDVAGVFCIDRFEDTLNDATSGKPVSPYFPPDAVVAPHVDQLWKAKVSEEGSPKIPLPSLPVFETAPEFAPRARSRADVVPQGYVSGGMAARACQRAGKRLCTEGEWRRACRGEQDRKFPYGDEYRSKLCNVMRLHHPAAILHGNASVGHSDPRLNLVSDDEGPLLKHTGATPTCASKWGTDAVYDMVGNVDEWIDDPGGTFVGGFYSRSTREGCDARVSVHPYDYWDYSTGVRCCQAGRSPASSPHATAPESE